MDKMGVTEKKKRERERERNNTQLLGQMNQLRAQYKLHIRLALLPLVVPRMPEITTQDLS